MFARLSICSERRGRNEANKLDFRAHCLHRFVYCLEKKTLTVYRTSFMVILGRGVATDFRVGGTNRRQVANLHPKYPKNR